VIVFNHQLDPALAKAAVAIEKHPFALHSASSDAISAQRPRHLYLLGRMPVLHNLVVIANRRGLIALHLEEACCNRVGKFGDPR
jgi:hypothetical protein